MKCLFFAVFFLLSSFTLAEPLSKQRLASRFYDATTAKLVDGMARGAAEAILRQDPSKVRQSAIYAQWAKESFHSPEYKNIYTDYYVEKFSVEELASMNEWANDPNFVSYMVKVMQFQQWSMPKFQEFMKSKKPELEKRLRTEGFDPNK